MPPRRNPGRAARPSNPNNDDNQPARQQRAPATTGGRNGKAAGTKAVAGSRVQKATPAAKAPGRAKGKKEGVAPKAGGQGGKRPRGRPPKKNAAAAADVDIEDEGTDEDASDEDDGPQQSVRNRQNKAGAASIAGGGMKTGRAARAEKRQQAKDEQEAPKRNIARPEVDGDNGGRGATNKADEDVATKRIGKAPIERKGFVPPDDANQDVANGDNDGIRPDDVGEVHGVANSAQQGPAAVVGDTSNRRPLWTAAEAMRERTERARRELLAPAQSRKRQADAGNDDANAPAVKRAKTPPPKPRFSPGKSRREKAAVFAAFLNREDIIKGLDKDLPRSTGSQWRGRVALGQGGFATVGLWLKIDNATNEVLDQVAVKQSIKVGDNPDHSGLPAEVTILQALSGRSQHLPTIRGFHAEKDYTEYRVYLQYCPFGSAGDYVAQRGLQIRQIQEEYAIQKHIGTDGKSASSLEARPVFAEPMILYIFEALVKAACVLHYGNEEAKNDNDWKRILHMDLKDDNLFLDHPLPREFAMYPCPVLSDFGLSDMRFSNHSRAQWEKNNDADHVLSRGTWPLQPPEQRDYIEVNGVIQRRGQDLEESLRNAGEALYDEKMTVYGIGITLARLMTGDERAPAVGNDKHKLHHEMLRNDPCRQKPGLPPITTQTDNDNILSVQDYPMLETWYRHLLVYYVRRCLEYDPILRPNLRALHRWVDDLHKDANIEEWKREPLYRALAKKEEFDIRDALQKTNWRKEQPEEILRAPADETALRELKQPMGYWGPNNAGPDPAEPSGYDYQFASFRPTPYQAYDPGEYNPGDFQIAGIPHSRIDYIRLCRKEAELRSALGTNHEKVLELRREILQIRMTAEQRHTLDHMTDDDRARFNATKSWSARKAYLDQRAQSTKAKWDEYNGVSDESRYEVWLERLPASHKDFVEGFLMTSEVRALFDDHDAFEKKLYMEDMLSKHLKARTKQVDQAEQVEEDAGGSEASE